MCLWVSVCVCVSLHDSVCHRTTLLARWCHSSDVFYLIRGAVCLTGLKLTHRLHWLITVLQGTVCLHLLRIRIACVHTSQYLIMVGGGIKGFFKSYFIVFLIWILGIELRSPCLQSKYWQTHLLIPHPYFLMRQPVIHSSINKRNKLDFPGHTHLRLHPSAPSQLSEVKYGIQTSM